MDFSRNNAAIPELAFTHAGRFHADDVFSAALLRLLRPDIRIYRGYDVPKGFSGIVFDIGFGPFDHHQKDSPKRENGVPYAAFGLLWREYGHHILTEKEAERFDENFIQPLDIDDNTGSGHLLATLIGSFNPSWDSRQDADDAFEDAVDVARQILYHRLKSILAIGRGLDAVGKALQTMEDGLVILPTYMPWKPVLIPSKAAFVAYPSDRGGFSVQCIQSDPRDQTSHKVPFPKAWHGQPEEKLQQLTGIDDITFLHASGFLATVGSEQSVRKLVELAHQHNAEIKADAANE